MFTKESVLRSITRLVEHPIHEHFAGYLAILRARQAKRGFPVGLTDIVDFHTRYLCVVGAPERAPFVRPFKSRGQGLETFNPNVAGSYAPSSLRSKGKLIDVIEVNGERQSATYSLREDHESLALDSLLKGNRVPIASLTAFLYRDYGFQLEKPDVASAINLFRREFGLSPDVAEQRKVFETLFTNDVESFEAGDLELLDGEAS